jgi:hypothetical protein
MLIHDHTYTCIYVYAYTYLYANIWIFHTNINPIKSFSSYPSMLFKHSTHHVIYIHYSSHTIHSITITHPIISSIYICPLLYEHRHHLLMTPNRCLIESGPPTLIKWEVKKRWVRSSCGNIWMSAYIHINEICNYIYIYIFMYTHTYIPFI